MPDKGLRDLGAFVPVNTRIEPKPLVLFNNALPQDPQLKPAPKIFVSDSAMGEDILGISGELAPLAELTAHKLTDTPLALGILGPAGSGKSFALAQLVRAIESLAKAEQHRQFHKDMLIVSVDASRLRQNPLVGVAQALQQALRKNFSNLANAAANAARDPQLASRTAAEKFETVSRQLDAQRQGLEEAESRRANLVETVLFSSASSASDMYARSIKGKLEKRFKRFGIDGDALLNFKDLLRIYTENPSPFKRFWLGLRAFFGFKGQTRLVITALLMLLAGWFLQYAIGNQGFWITPLRGNETTLPLATWFQTHMDWLLLAQKLVFAGSALAVCLNIWRGFGFLQPVLRGASILANDLTLRRRDANLTIANQTRRVEALNREAETLAFNLAEAEKRAGGPAGSMATFLEPHQGQEAGDFLAQISARISSKKLELKSPERIIFAFDHFEGLTLAETEAVLASLQALLLPGFIVLLALDPEKPNFGEKIEKLVHVPFQISKTASQSDLTPLLQALIGQEPGTRIDTAAPLSLLEDPLSEGESQLLLQFVALAGRSPRAIKRFVNLYRLCRRKEAHRGALALWLALDAGGRFEEIELLQKAMQNQIEPDFVQKSPALAHGLAAADGFGPKLTMEALQQAAAIAKPFSFRLWQGLK